MADSFTSNLVLTKPEVGGSESDWGGKLNADFDAIASDASKTNAGDPNGSVAGDYIGQRCYDTTNRVIWVCRSAGNAASALWACTGIALSTKLLFPDTTTAPAGWTILTTSGYNNSTVRINTAGTGSTAGSVDFDTAFAAGRTSDSHIITTAEMPAHTHTASSHTHTFSATTGSTQLTPTFHSGFAVGAQAAAYSPGEGTYGDASTAHTHTVSGTTGGTTSSDASAGSDGGHTHGMPSFAVKYVHSVICSRSS